MAITDKEQGVWGLDQVYNKINQGSIWEYSTSALGMYAWGGNEDNGELGLNDTNERSSPTQVPGITNWSKVIMGRAKITGGITSDGELWAWGYNDQGQLGQNNTVKYSSPVQIPGTTWSSAVVGGDNNGWATLSIKTDGTLWAWGENNYGGLGQNNLGDRSSPVQIPGTNWSYCWSGMDQYFGINTSGELYAWGANGSGRLGINQPTNSHRSSPTQIPGTTWAYVKGGGIGHAIATKTDGTLWCWGAGSNGPLAQNDQTNYSSPRQVPGTDWDASSASKINAGQYLCHAIKTDGTLWGWGANYLGRRGDNTQGTRRSSPVQIPGTTWSAISGSYDPILAFKTDGTLWSWGGNQDGELGQNNTTQRSSPTQLPGTDWKTGFAEFAGKRDYAVALKDM